MNKRIWILMCIVFFLILVIPHEVPNYGDDTDYPWTYIPAAKGEIVDQYHGFVYPLVLKTGNMIWDDWILTGRIISALAMAGSLYFIFRMTQWTGTILLLLTPLFWHCGYHLTGDALAWFFMCGAYWAWWNANYYERSVFNFEELNRWLRNDYMLIVSGILAGLAFCTRYQMILLSCLVFIIPRKLNIEPPRWKSWGKRMIKYVTPFLAFAIFQIVLNLRHGFGVLGNNIFNISEKGTALNVGKIAENLIVFPVRIMLEAWPLFGILFVLSVYELVKRRRYELLILTFGTLCMVCVSFYSFRFFLPMMFPVVIGASAWIGRNLEVTIKGRLK